MDDLEDRLRQELRRQASGEQHSTDAWERIAERVRQPERRTTTSRVLVAATVLAITAGGLFALWRGFVATDERPPAGDGAPPATGEETPPAIEDLWGRTFVSTRVTEGGETRTLVPPGTSIELTFFEERGSRGVRWSGGCNIFGTSLAITPDRLLVGEFEGTQQLCRQDVAEQDEWLVAFFGSDPRWELIDDTLTLMSGETIITFEAKGS